MPSIAAGGRDPALHQPRLGTQNRTRGPHTARRLGRPAKTEFWKHAFVRPSEAVSGRGREYHQASGSRDPLPAPTCTCTLYRPPPRSHLPARCCPCSKERAALDHEEGAPDKSPRRLVNQGRNPLAPGGDRCSDPWTGRVPDVPGSETCGTAEGGQSASARVSGRRPACMGVLGPRPCAGAVSWFGRQTRAAFGMGSWSAGLLGFF